MNNFLVKYSKTLPERIEIDDNAFNKMFYAFNKDKALHGIEGNLAYLCYLPLSNDEDSFNPKIYSHNGNFIISDSFLINKNELSDKLALNDNMPDGELILHAYQKWGEKCAGFLEGDFSFVIYNQEKQELFLCRDHMGIRPLYYALTGDGILVSNQQAMIKEYLKNVTYSKEYLYDLLLMDVSNKEYTLYDEIKRLPSAHTFTYTFKENRLEKYWELNTKKFIDKTDAELINEFRELLTTTIANRTNNYERIACELSGGIDSSTITAFICNATKKQQADIKCFSHVLAEEIKGKMFPFKDETEFIEAAINHFHISPPVFIKNWAHTILELMHKAFQIQGGLHMQRYQAFSIELLKEAHKHNVSVLFSGFGGDEMVSSHVPGYFTDFLREKGIFKLYKKYREFYGSHKIATRYIIPTFFRHYFPKVFFGIYNLLKLKNSEANLFKKFPLKTAAIKGYNLKERFSNQDNITNYKGIKKKQLFKVSMPHVSARLEACFHIGRYYDIDYAYPLLNKRLLEFYYNLPNRLFAHKQFKRYFIRKVIEPYLPSKIVWRNDKSGTTIPGVLYHIIKNQEEIRTFLTKCKKERIGDNIVDIDKMLKWLDAFDRRKDKKTRPSVASFLVYLNFLRFLEQTNISL